MPVLNTDSPVRNPFNSFWMGGFECTDKLNCFGNRVDFLSVTGHLERIDKDYQELSFFNIKTVREGIRWSVVEKAPYQYDWSAVIKMIEAGIKHDIQQIWDLCHFGFPDDITPLHPMFARRFAALCRAFVTMYRSIDAKGQLIIIPINEISFLSWLGGDACGTSPYCRNNGWEVKYSLSKAFIEGIEAIRSIDSNTLIMVTEPLIHIVPKPGASEEEIAEVKKRHDDQYQVLDILLGRMCPELRGRPDYIDIIGSNFYFTNQWEWGSWQVIHWRNVDNDPRWKSVGELIREIYNRYKKPIILAETSHPREDRPIWIDYIADECYALLKEGIPLYGICWYPIIDRPDWDHMQPWHYAGLWDIDNSEGKLERVLHEPSATAFLNAQALIANAFEQPFHAKAQKSKAKARHSL